MAWRGLPFGAAPREFLVWHFRPEVPLVFGLGSFAIAALFGYQMCYRLTPEDRIRPSSLVFVFVFGGLAAYILSRLIEPLLDVALGGRPEDQPLAYPWIATPIEELCKIAIVLVIARWISVKNARIGLFIGGAIGFGFAAYENVEKVFSTYINAGGGVPTAELKFVNAQAIFGHVTANVAIGTGVREVLTPFAHPIWTALIAAAVFTAYRGSKFRITRTVVIVFVAVAVVHALWDFVPAVFNRVFADAPGLALLVAYGVYAVFGIAGAVVWNVVRKRSNGALAAHMPSDLPELS